MWVPEGDAVAEAVRRKPDCLSFFILKLNVVPVDMVEAKHLEAFQASTQIRNEKNRSPERTTGN
jgi:hypothetical protein